MTLSLLAETLPTSKETALFDYPFNELLVSTCFMLALREYYLGLPMNDCSIVTFCTVLGRKIEDSLL